jgi:hypothetical protein
MADKAAEQIKFETEMLKLAALVAVATGGSAIGLLLGEHTMLRLGLAELGILTTLGLTVTVWLSPRSFHPLSLPELPAFLQLFMRWPCPSGRGNLRAVLGIAEFIHHNVLAAMHITAACAGSSVIVTKSRSSALTVCRGPSSIWAFSAAHKGCQKSLPNKITGRGAIFRVCN